MKLYSDRDLQLDTEHRTNETGHSKKTTSVDLPN